MTVYAIGATALTGDGAALDGEYVENIGNGDPAFVTVQSGRVYHYIADSTSGATADGINIIIPLWESVGVAYTGDLRWILTKVYNAVGTSGTPVDNDFAKFTDAETIEGRSYAETKSDLGLNLVENTAHSTDAHTMTIDGRDVSADGTKLDGIEAGADVTDATNVDAAGAVMEADFNAHTILQATANDTPAALTVEEQTLVGRITGGNITALNTTQIRTLINVEDGADVTDTTNVTAAGALMDSEVDADIKTLSLPANTTISVFGATLVDDANAAAAKTTLGLSNVENTAHSTDAHAMTIDGRDVSVDGAKLDNIESSADKTDAVNIASSIAGVDAKTTPIDSDTTGLIDSEAASALKKVSWANIKATLKAYFDTIYVYTLSNHASNHTDGTDDIQSATAAQKGLATAAQITKLDGIEAGAEANNISDANATDLTDGGDTALHDHDGISENTAARHTQGTDTALGAVGTKSPPIDADKAIYRDSTASDALVTSTWTQIKAFLKTYFDTLYTAIGAVIPATQVEVAELGTATYDDVQDFINTVGNRTRISGGNITAHADADGSIAIAACTGWCHITDADAALGVFFDYAGKAKQTLTDLSINTIYLDYNGGTPQIVVGLDYTTYGFKQDHIFIGSAFRNGTDLHIIQGSNVAIEGINKRFMHDVETSGLHRASGLVTSSVGTRQLDITVGVLYLGSHRQTTAAFNTSTGDTFSYWHTSDSGATWTEVTGQAAISNTQYNDITAGLVSLTSNRYGVHWVYMDSDGEHFHVVYGQGDYTAAQEELATPPSVLPPIASEFCLLIAKIICQEGTDVLTILYPWITVFQSSLAQDHGSLAGLGDDDHSQYFLADGTRALGALSAKNPPIDADKVIYRDSTSSDVLVTSTWTQVKAFLKTYFDTLYNLYVHPNHSGDVTSVADGAQTIENGVVTYAKMQNISATMKILGRTTAGAGDAEELSFLDEDDMASDSAVAIPTQQSVKAYVDAQIAKAIALGTL